MCRENKRAVFLLDTSSWCTVRDQDLEFHEGELQEESTPRRRALLGSRIESQVAAMKLLCCSRETERVGVVHMGGSLPGVRVHLQITEQWRKNETGTEGILSDYKPGPSDPPTSSTEDSCPDPMRILQALNLCLDMLRDDRRRTQESDLYDADEIDRITMFLCSPPTGFGDLEASQAFNRLVTEIESLDVRMEIVMHPDAYSPHYHVRGNWPKYDAGSIPRDRCSKRDMESLETMFKTNFNANIAKEDFVLTCSMYNDVFFQGCDSQDWVKEMWETCWPSGCEGFPNSFFSWNWSLEEC